MSIYVETPDVRIIIDPGASVMQPSFPLEKNERESFQRVAFEEIGRWSRTTDLVIVTHYHHDHYADPKDAPAIYRDKLLLVKEPNQWINRSQWHRARVFFEELAELYARKPTDVRWRAPQTITEHDAKTEHPMAFAKNFGDYNARRMQILQRGNERLTNLKAFWQSESWLQEQDFARIRVRFADGRSFQFGDTVIRFTDPLFHGVEYATVGWTLALVIEYGSSKFLFTSDLQGPTIEDYAEWIIAEQPNVAVIDGPPTYLFGHVVNRTNMQRAIDNALRIFEGLPETTIIYDHHLPRDVRFRQRMAPLFERVQVRKPPRFMTMAEWCGRPPIVEELAALKV